MNSNISPDDCRTDNIQISDVWQSSLRSLTHKSGKVFLTISNVNMSLHLKMIQRKVEFIRLPLGIFENFAYKKNKNNYKVKEEKMFIIQRFVLTKNKMNKIVVCKN